MGGFIAIALLVLLFAGSIGLWNRLIRALTHQTKTPHQPTTEVPRGPRAMSQHHLKVFLKALENEGYMGSNRLPDSELEYVDDPVLSRMIDKLAKEYELEWVLPDYQLRYRRVPETAPEAFREKYEWVVLTPTHAIGYR